MDTKSQVCKPEVWGGVECTINRIQNVYRDQLLMAGHYNRQGDIEKIASLGISRIRYPVLWERHMPRENSCIDWQFTRQRLSELRAHSIIPIIGLLHHGSGPAYTNLLDDDFPDKLAVFAGIVAREFPWIEHYTPVNEPLTTARFSGLYGLWYPHVTRELDFFKMFLNQLKAIVLSIKAVRKINPGARLVQTEDLSKIYSDPVLSYQAAFENERRWLTYDFLSGRVDRSHFFWNYLKALGISVATLDFFLENACPPDIMGFNYYVTSERYLDSRIENYPPAFVGGNGKHRYVDVEAVRKGCSSGIVHLLREAWKRYGSPMAITECHLNCTPDEQQRWLMEIWNGACSLAGDGIPLKAVTIWSLLGAFDWSSLLTLTNKDYETGAFDISSGVLQETPLASVIRSLAANGHYHHPLLVEQGWWHKCITRPKVARSAA